MNQYVIQSMTGYGESSYKETGIHIYVQMISLNSRSFDLHFDIPNDLQGYTMEWRELLANKLKRGRVQLCIKIKYPKTTPLVKEKEVIAAYFHSLQNIAQELNATTDLLGKAIDIALYQSGESILDLTSRYVHLIQVHIEKALQGCLRSRQEEGERLGSHLNSYLAKIKDYLIKTEEYLPTRKKITKERLIEQKKALDLNGISDPATWEKEISQYWDKVDVEEEMVRLKSHLVYLENTLSKNRPIGKQLNFIIQEMARELNTIGAKAQDSTLQYLVIEMKEALEQLKEQVQNIL